MSCELHDPRVRAVQLGPFRGRTLTTELPALLKQAMDDPDVTVAAVCGGSLVLAMAGLLEDRHATTHHLGLDLLDATGAHAVSARVVDDGNRPTWRQAVTKPMRLNLAFDVTVDGDTLKGTSKAGRLPSSRVTGERLTAVERPA
ncbi:DJ-1/PfpI family protein [Streptomyces sp. NPDC003393]